MSIANLTGTTSTQARAVRVSVWELTTLAVRAFRDQPQSRMQWPILRTLCLRVLLLASLTTSERRVHADGDAFCVLTLSSVRTRLTGAAVGVGCGITIALSLVLLASFSPLLLCCVLLAAAVVLLPSLVLTVRTTGSRDRLTASAPAGPLVGVHTVTSSRPGHGAEVIRMVALEADTNGWSLILDAANDRLADYYRQFGFRPCGEAVHMPWGERVVRMVRRPTIDGE